MVGRAVAWDLFCRVVDNYGDIGIGWRLAKQLAVDEDKAVRLIVDGLDAFARIEPRVDASRARQTVDTITIVAWSEADRDVADVVVELLGGGLPVAYLDAMAVRDRAPVWIDFEHLSAEDWVADFHALPSPHPALPLTKHFFYPGFGAGTGGLLVEPGLATRRERSLASPDSWRPFGLDAPIDGERRISLFAYPSAPVAELLQALADDGARRWTVIVPGGLGAIAPAGVRVVSIAFMDQTGYDRLLWLCDVNFVRGEDSFVRAQVAGRPLVWHIYPQPDDVHLQKLAAFETVYASALGHEERAAQNAFWLAWNAHPRELAERTGDWIAALPALRSHAIAWADRIARETPLIRRLETFVAAHLERPVC